MTWKHLINTKHDDRYRRFSRYINQLIVPVLKSTDEQNHKSVLVNICWSVMICAIISKEIACLCEYHGHVCCVTSRFLSTLVFSHGCRLKRNAAKGTDSSRNLVICPIVHKTSVISSSASLWSADTNSCTEHMCLQYVAICVFNGARRSSAMRRERRGNDVGEGIHLLSRVEGQRLTWFMGLSIFGWFSEVRLCSCVYLHKPEQCVCVGGGVVVPNEWMHEVAPSLFAFIGSLSKISSSARWTLVRVFLMM